MKRLRVKKGAEGLPFHVRAAAALGMWLALAEVAPKGYRVPKALERLTLQLIDDAVQLPALATRTCRDCGCTDDRACEGGCWWVANDLCSSCASAPALKRGIERRDARERKRWRGENAGRSKR